MLKIEMDSSEIVTHPEAVIEASEMPVTSEEWKTLEKGETGSVKRSVLYNEGYDAGFKSAADDYVNGKCNLELFEKLRKERDITDFFAIGFEMGYFRKLAEILMF